VFSLKDVSAVARDPEVAAAVDAVDRYLLGRSGPERFRLERASPDGTPDIAAYRGLGEIGVIGALVPEEMGGSGFPPGVAMLIAERLGCSLAREPYIENVVLPGALLLALGANALVHDSCSGAIPCVAWQESEFGLPGQCEVGTRVSRHASGFRIRGRKRFVMGARASTFFIVLASMDDEPVIVCVNSTAPGVVRQDKLLADGTHWSDLELDVEIGAEAVLARGADCRSALVKALALANLALAGMLHGLQSQILAMTLEYLRTRVQFDKPIGAFQALQHRAVDLYTHAQIARFLLGEAADAVGPAVSADTLEVYASRAKARTVDSALRIVKEGIQMHGGIGFSDEYDLGLYVKRILVLSAWLGGADWHRRRCAALDAYGVEG